MIIILTCTCGYGTNPYLYPGLPIINGFACTGCSCGCDTWLRNHGFIRVHLIPMVLSVLVAWIDAGSGQCVLRGDGSKGGEGSSRGGGRDVTGGRSAEQHAGGKNSFIAGSRKNRLNHLLTGSTLFEGFRNFWTTAPQTCWKFNGEMVWG